MGDGRVHYARNGDVRLAYRVFGDSGPIFVWAPGWVVNNVDTIDDPGSPYAGLVAQFSHGIRLVMFDKRGSGLSDPLTHAPSLDEKMDDLRAVIDVVTDDEVALFGSGDGGPVTVLFAATYPDRVSSLVLYGTAARFSQELPDFPWGFTAAEIQAQLQMIDDHWGEGALAELFFNEVADQPGVRDMFGKLQRSIASPTMARLSWQAFMETDVRAVLPAVRAPTLVVIRPGNRLVPFEAAEALAAAIPGALFEALPPGAHNAFDVVNESAYLATQFVLGRPTESVDERVLKTVMFTDIVSSTEKLTAGGDAHWRYQLDSHDTLVDHVLSRHDGVRASTPETASSRSSTRRRRRCDARWTSFPHSRRGRFPSASASTLANVSGAVTNGAVSPYTQARESRRWQARVRCWPAARSVTSRRVRG